MLKKLLDVKKVKQVNKIKIIIYLEIIYTTKRVVFLDNIMKGVRK